MMSILAAQEAIEETEICLADLYKNEEPEGFSVFLEDLGDDILSGIGNFIKYDLLETLLYVVIIGAIIIGLGFLFAKIGDCLPSGDEGGSSYSGEDSSSSSYTPRNSSFEYKDERGNYYDPNTDGFWKDGQYVHKGDLVKDSKGHYYRAYEEPFYNDDGQYVRKGDQYKDKNGNWHTY